MAAIEYDPVEDIDLSPPLAEGQPECAWSQLAPSQHASLRWFVYEIAAGDTIYAKSGPRIVGRGEVVGPYQFDTVGSVRSATAIWRHQRRVRWDEGFQEIEYQLGSQQIVTVVRLSDEEAASIEAAVGGLAQQA